MQAGDAGCAMRKLIGGGDGGAQQGEGGRHRSGERASSCGASILEHPVRQLGSYGFWVCREGRGQAPAVLATCKTCPMSGL